MPVILWYYHFDALYKTEHLNDHQNAYFINIQGTSCDLTSP